MRLSVTVHLSSVFPGLSPSSDSSRRKLDHYLSGLVSILVLMDLNAASDSINRSILLHRLEHIIGIKGTALGWFKSYASAQMRVCYGVQQGSVLGPIFFLTHAAPGKYYLEPRH